MSIKSMMPSSHLILCRPLLLLSSIFPNIRVFSNESALRMRWPKYWSFSFNISPSNEHPGLISFRMDWLDVIFKKLFYIVASISYWLPIRSSVGKESTCNAGDPSLIPFLGRSAGEGTGLLLQYSWASLWLTW